MKNNIFTYLKILVVLSTILTAANLFAAHWVFVPSSPNELKKGDVILTKDPDGILTPIFDGMGHIWDHALMVVDNNGTLRHNTVRFNSDLKSSAIKMKKYRFRVYDKFGNILLMRKSFSLPEKIDEKILQGLPPGIINGRRSPGKYRVRLTTRNEENRKFLEEAADEMNKMQGYYVLNSFISMESYEPAYDKLSAKPHQGSHCSGTIWWANKYKGKTMNIPVRYEPEMILQCAENIHNSFVKYFTDMLNSEINNEINRYKGSESNKYKSVFTIHLYIIVKFLEDYILNDFKKQIKHHLFKRNKIPQRFANQIVNSFLFNRNDDDTYYWQDHYDEVIISSLAPDNLLMAGMPDLNGKFNGEQTKSSSFYDAIEDYSESGGYYIKIKDGNNDDLPIDPRLNGEPPKMIVSSHEGKPVHDGQDYNGEFEIVPMPEEVGGKNSKKFFFDIKNINLITPLELNGDPPIKISGDKEFEIIQQPDTESIQGGSKTSFGIKFSFEPDAPGEYSTVISIPNTDPERSDYSFKFKVNAINESYFIENPVYYNQCDSDESLKKPLIGSQYNQKIIEKSNGPYLQKGFIDFKFNKGFYIGHNGEKEKNYKQALIYPFNTENDPDKPDITAGTCTFWASSRGTWRKKRDDTYIDAFMYFYLTYNTYIKTCSASYPTSTILNFYVDGEPAHSGTQYPEGSIINVTLQWDFLNGFADGSNIKLYSNSELVGSYISLQGAHIINESIQYFKLITRTMDEGDYRPKGSYSGIDNIIIWDKVIDVGDIADL